MFQAAARRIASLVEDERARNGRLFPPIRNLRQVSLEVAEAVSQVAIDHDLADLHPPQQVTLKEYLAQRMWDPAYSPLVPIPQ
mmetsp:Transcript_3371/g.5911  ORF Transcript_3371/g.5911 Transcript_3371/m.5911 type:complete len:83 (+) Transcript_3371:1-249(+)